MTKENSKAKFSPKNDLTKFVMAYKADPTEDNFLPIWKILESKLSYIAYSKAKTTPLLEDDVLGILYETLLNCIKNFSEEKSNFSTYMYTAFNNRLSSELLVINRQKRKIFLNTVQILPEDDNSKEYESSFKSKDALQSLSFLETVTPKKAIGYRYANIAIDELINS
jgi:hypothetical protein